MLGRHRLALGSALGALVVSSALGCASHVAENERLLTALEHAERSRDEDRHRVLDLERRLLELEASRRAEAHQAEQNELARVVEKAHELMLESQRVLAESQARAAATAAPAPSADGAACSPAGDAKVMVRYWLERLRNDPGQAGRWRGGLSPAQLDAVNVLLRGERSLDAQNPWPSSS